MSCHFYEGVHISPSLIYPWVSAHLLCACQQGTRLLSTGAFSIPTESAKKNIMEGLQRKWDAHFSCTNPPLLEHTKNITSHHLHNLHIACAIGRRGGAPKQSFPKLSIPQTVRSRCPFKSSKNFNPNLSFLHQALEKSQRMVAGGTSYLDDTGFPGDTGFAFWLQAGISSLRAGAARLS